MSFAGPEGEKFAEFTPSFLKIGTTKYLSNMI